MFSASVPGNVYDGEASPPLAREVLMQLEVGTPASQWRPSDGRRVCCRPLCRVPKKKTASAGAVLAATRLFAVETRDSRDRGRGEAGQQTRRSQDGLQSAAGACCPGRRTVIQGTSPRRTAPGPLPSLDPGSAVDGCKDRSGSTEFPGHTTEPRAEEGFCRFAKTFFFVFAVSRVKTRRYTR